MLEVVITQTCCYRYFSYPILLKVLVFLVSCIIYTGGLIIDSVVNGLQQSSRRDDGKRRDSRDDWDSDRDRRSRDHSKRKASRVPPPLPRAVPWVPPPIPQQPIIQNQFRNDGSFMELFRQQMNAATTDSTAGPQSTAATSPGASLAVNSPAEAVADGASGTTPVLPVVRALAVLCHLLRCLYVFPEVYTACFTF